MSGPLARPLDLALRVAPLILYLAFIWSVSDTPGDDLSVSLDDRLAHFGEYFLLMLLTTFAITGFDPARVSAPSLAAATVFCLAWAVLDEVHQSWVPGRDPSVKDLVFDAFGTAAAAVLLTLVAARDRRRT